jgi:hypothetical protein
MSFTLPVVRHPDTGTGRRAPLAASRANALRMGDDDWNRARPVYTEIPSGEISSGPCVPANRPASVRAPLDASRARASSPSFEPT